eukprot:gb/GECG01010872.1/.p1 GENE.gb/GECG01010872.1/~~gb/GECG01010872.1/.p1  ORF type:complete len:228 (+),score=45.07 gb/GECG01010872.1/:1-684(+)
MIRVLIWKRFVTDNRMKGDKQRALTTFSDKQSATRLIDAVVQEEDDDDEELSESRSFPSDSRNIAFNNDVVLNDESGSMPPAEERAYLQAQLRAAIPIKKSFKDRMLGKVYDSAQEEPKEYQEAWGRVQLESWAHITGNVSPWCLATSQEKEAALSQYKSEVVGSDGPEYPDNSNISSYTGSIDVHTVSHRVEEHLTKVWNQWVHDNVKGKNKTPSSLGSRHGWRKP